MADMPANAANDTRASTTGERNIDHAPDAQHGAPPRAE
jgi:hypothetical protein